jgi:hypothetical protein
MLTHECLVSDGTAARQLVVGATSIALAKASQVSMFVRVDVRAPQIRARHGCR